MQRLSWKPMRFNCQHLLVLLAAACCAPWCTTQPLEVVKLTDKTFEHQTQASTGQTTGHWCVLFTDSSADSEAQIAAEEAWEELAADEDKAVIYAAVDVASSPQLGVRFFGSPQQQRFPAVRLFRDRQMYAFPGRLQPEPDAIRQALLSFLAGGFQEVEGQPVPGQPSALSGVSHTLQQLRGQAEQWGGAVAVTAGVVLFLGAALAGMALKRQAPSSVASPATPYSSRPGSRRTSSPGGGGTKPAAAGPGKSGLAHMNSALAAEFNEALTEGGDDDGGGGTAKAAGKTATHQKATPAAGDKKAD